MSGAKYTPGPLYALHHGTSLRHEIRKDHGDVSHLIATFEDDEEAEANATLFAAAPELLEAAQAFVAWADGAGLQVAPNRPCRKSAGSHRQGHWRRRMTRAARMTTTRAGITIGIAFQPRPPRPDFYAERIQAALLEPRTAARPRTVARRLLGIFWRWC